jgi:hypothetical protein
VPERLVAKSVLGDCHIELQDALLTARHTTIEASAVLGSVVVRLPDWTTKVSAAAESIVEGFRTSYPATPTAADREPPPAAGSPAGIDALVAPLIDDAFIAGGGASGCRHRWPGRARSSRPPPRSGR